MAVTAFDGIVGFRNSVGTAVRIEYSASVYGSFQAESDGDLLITTTGSEVRIGKTLRCASGLNVQGNTVDMANLPTSDPTSAGRLWNDGGTVKVSSG